MWVVPLRASRIASAVNPDVETNRPISRSCRMIPYWEAKDKDNVDDDRVQVSPGLQLLCHVVVAVEVTVVEDL